MTTSALNPVTFTTGTIITLTEEFRRSAKRLVKVEPLLGTSDEFFIVGVRETKAEDEHTEVLESTLGATVLKHVRTGKVLDINDIYLDERDDYWAFFTQWNAERFNIVE